MDGKVISTLFYYALQFIVGGASVVGVTAIAKYIHPKYTGIAYAFPAVLIISMLFIYADQGINVSRETLRSTFVYEFTLVYFIFIFYILLGRYGFFVSMITALLSWIVFVVLVKYFFKM